MTIPTFPRLFFRDLRLELDFFLRSHLRWRLPVRTLGSRTCEFSQLQSELTEFLDNLLPPFSTHNPIVLDVGAKDFFAGPPIDRWFRKRGMTAQLHAIELDAFRRLWNFKTRADYGEYMARSCAHGHYHAMDFLKWHSPADAIFLLHPFVSEGPMVRWGLPRRLLRSEELFKHAARLLKPEGMLVLSTPNEEEDKIAQRLLRNSGLRRVRMYHWKPRTETLQQKPRLGSVWIA